MEVYTVAILGLFLLLAVTGLAITVVLENTSSISVDALGMAFSASPGWLFVLGLAAGVVGVIGVSLLAAGITRARRRRAALTESRTSVEGLQAERDRLAVELERERAARTATTAGPRTATTAGPRSDDRPAADDDSSVINLAEERRPVTDRQEPVGSGRRDLFHRRH